MQVATLVSVWAVDWWTGAGLQRGCVTSSIVPNSDSDVRLGEGEVKQIQVTCESLLKFL